MTALHPLRLLALGLGLTVPVALCAQTPSPAQAAPLETTAQCIVNVQADYDAKIAKAQAEGEAGAKKVALYIRKRAEYVEACEVKDRIAAIKADTAAIKADTASADQRIAANRAEIAAMNTTTKILNQVIAGQKKLSAQELSTLAQIRSDMQAQPASDSTKRAIEEAIGLIELKTGQKIAPAVVR